MMAAAGGSARYATKLVETRIDQALILVQTGGIETPPVYANTCLTLGRAIETAIAMNAVPSPSHLLQLLLIVKEVYIRKAGLRDSSLMTLMIHIKSACQVGWFSNEEDKDCLLMMVDKTTLVFYNLDNSNDEPANARLVTEIISRFYPRMRVEEILASFNVKAGDGPSEADFFISPSTVPDQNLWLLVARTDNMDTSACLTSPSNVDFLINNKEVPKRTRKEMGKGPQLPTNVTKMVKDRLNNLQAIGEFDGEYVIVLAIMSLISSPDSSQLQDYVHPMSNDDESDCVLTKGPAWILLDCPNSGGRIRTPVKGRLCTHSQCFDYDFFMESNFLRPSWKCPLAYCKKPICNLDIRVDRTFLKILNEVGDDVLDVYVSDDGSWTVSLAEKSQINMDAINQQNHVPGDTETHPISSGLHNTGGFVIETSPLVQQTRSDLNPTATQVPAQAQSQNNQTLTNDPTESDNSNHTVQSSCDLVHTPPQAQQTGPDLNPTTSHLPEPQNSQNEPDQPTEADNGTCTSDQGPRRSNRVRRASVFTPVLLTPPSAAPVLRKLKRRPRSTTDEAQGTTLVSPAITKREQKRKIPTIPAVGTEAQGTNLAEPVIKKKRGRKPKIPSNPPVGLYKKQVCPNQVPEVRQDETAYVGMRGGLTGKDREAALLKFLAPPIQPADKPWPGPTTKVPVELLMKQLNVSHPSDLPR